MMQGNNIKEFNDKIHSTRTVDVSNTALVAGVTRVSLRVCVCARSTPAPSTLLVAQCSNLYHTGCFLIQHDLSPGCHPGHQENHHDSQAMISGGTVGEERPRGLLEAHLL